jgi:PPOX class probable F420-dependent enzyme
MMAMDIAVAQQFLRENEHAVLATWRRDGRLQMSPVTVGLDGAWRAIISSRDTAYKVRNLRRDPRATLCVLVEACTGPWVQMEGTAEVISLPDAMELLVDYYRRLAGERAQQDRGIVIESRAEQGRYREDDMAIDHPLMQHLAHLCQRYPEIVLKQSG